MFIGDRTGAHRATRETKQTIPISLSRHAFTNTFMDPSSSSRVKHLKRYFSHSWISNNAIAPLFRLIHLHIFLLMEYHFLYTYTPFVTFRPRRNPVRLVKHHVFYRDDRTSIVSELNGDAGVENLNGWMH